MKTSQFVLSIIVCQVLFDLGWTVHTSDRTKNYAPISEKMLQCNRKYNLTYMEFNCSNEFLSDQIEIDDLNSTILESILTLRVTGKDRGSGPLRTIPSNICRFRKLQSLNLHSNRIQNMHFNWTIPCLSELRTLRLSNNLISHISVEWFNQMPLLEHIYLSSNLLTVLPYGAFRNLLRLRILDVSHNLLTSIELWTIQIQDNVDYEFNIISRFSNRYNVDLSQLPSRKIPEFDIDRNPRIQFDDTIFAMYNRCVEVHNNTSHIFNNSTSTLTRAVLSIIKLANPKETFYRDCSCDRFYFYRTALAVEGYPNNASSENWICPGKSIPFIEQCNNRSSADFTKVIPRLCKIDQSESGEVPVYEPPSQSTVTSTTQQTTTTTSIFPEEPHEIERYLGNITVLDNSTIQNFISIINKINITIGSNISEETKIIYQKIIRHIENLIESVNSSLNTSDGPIALISTTKTNPIYHFNQFTLSNSSIIYSFESESNHSTAKITITDEYIQQLSNETLYSFFFLPSALFQYAHIDSHIEILSPIVGAHLPIGQSLTVQMSFDVDRLPRSSGSYACVFWQVDRWNDTGCHYSIDTMTNRHHCQCDHLTSFALIFTPDGILPATFLPTIITSCLSIVGLIISIILSIYQQINASTIRRSRRYSAANIFSLSSILILFILFTVLLIINYQSSATTTSTTCRTSMLNLVLATYFFVILTFVTKTLFGIYYYCTTFVDFKSNPFSDRPNRYYLISILVIILIPLVSTIVASVLSFRHDDIIVSKNNACWFRGKYLIGFVTIPVSIFIGINMLIVLLIGISLFRFLCNPRVDQAKEKRLMVTTCIWIASCVLLGILWIGGPLLNLFVDDNSQSTSTSSIVMQWIFALLSGLEGVWVLIVNILFYIRQRANEQSRRTYSPHGTNQSHLLDGLGKNDVDNEDHQN